ncbi:MAG: response regulator, partial [Planctomycetes bacterium]|nr:response regulator [Planctomycetota bacterium]
METLRVLIVDDEAGMRTGVVRALTGAELDLPDIDGPVPLAVDAAADGEEALRRLQDARPDLLLLDHRLPGISGLEILEKVAGEPDMLTIMITAYASLEMAVNATKRGAFDFLAKPFTPQELKATVRKAARHLLLQREARRLADEKRRMRFELLSILAHELKAPLAAIDGYLRLIQQRVAGEELASYDRMVDRSIIRLDGMKKLIYDLLDLTRIESGHKKRDIAPVDLAEMAQLSAETVAPAAAERHVTVALHVAASVPMTADRGELEIILNNLLSNAVKYNRDGGRVDL